jgi:hypothetical protein
MIFKTVLQWSIFHCVKAWFWRPVFLLATVGTVTNPLIKRPGVCTWRCATPQGGKWYYTYAWFLTGILVNWFVYSSHWGSLGFRCWVAGARPEQSPARVDVGAGWCGPVALIVAGWWVQVDLGEETASLVPGGGTATKWRGCYFRADKEFQLTVSVWWPASIRSTAMYTSTASVPGLIRTTAVTQTFSPDLSRLSWDTSSRRVYRWCCFCRQCSSDKIIFSPKLTRHLSSPTVVRWS